jgi:hypothetical protein
MQKTKSSHNLLTNSTQDALGICNIALNAVTFNEVPRTRASDIILKQKYPSDINLLETVTINTDRESAIEFIAEHLPIIAQQLLVHQMNNDIWTRYFKIGVDNRFELGISQFSTSDELTDAAVTLYKSELIDESTYKNLNAQVHDWKNYKEILGTFRTIHWSLFDILNGHKILIGNKKVYLKDILKTECLVRLEIVSLLEKKMRHIEVYYHFCYLDEGVEKPLYRLNDSLDELIKQMIRYNTMPYDNPILLMRTMWTYSFIYANSEVIRRLNASLTSDLLAVNQADNDIVLLYELFNGYQLINDDINAVMAHQKKLISIAMMEIIDVQKRLSNSLSASEYNKFKFDVINKPLYIDVFQKYLRMPSIFEELNGLSLMINDLLVTIHTFLVELLQLKRDRFQNLASQVLLTENRKQYLFIT